VRFELGPGRLHVEPGTGGVPVVVDPDVFVLAFFGRRLPPDEHLISLLTNFIPS
jgi:hypothetical protein